jgi:hypothetical protein
LVDGQQQGCFGVALQPADPVVRLVADRDAFLAQQFAAADQDDAAVAVHAHALSQQDFAFLVRWDLDASFFRVADHGLGQRVSRVDFGAGRVGQDPFR